MNILGVDIGGTFTDFVLLSNGEVSVYKLPSTPDNPARALLQGVATMATVPQTLVHGTTVATNALLERRGALTALLTTAGFADVLVIGRGTRPSLYDLGVERAEPLIPSALRLEVCERIAADGTVLQPLDESQFSALAEHLIQAGVEAIAVCFLHSYNNAEHEQRAVALLEHLQAAASRPAFFVCRSSEILPQYREYERMSTTVVNAYVAPVLDRYLGEIEHMLQAQANTDSLPILRIMASDGGSMTVQMARRLAARTTLSGPAGGVLGARAIAQQAGFPRIISLDMGGTSTDVAVCDNTLPQIHTSYVGDLPVCLPALDIHTVGAGGGSLARIDAGGALRVGPQSAGAAPGPACYGRGTQPTVTDANVVLGRLRAEAFLGGEMTLDVSRASAALAPLAQSLGLDITTAALGVIRVANAAMERAIRALSVERGKDPRHFVLVAFGGAGSLHATYLATALGMQRVLIPRHPGVLSALGMLTADVTRDHVQFLAQQLDHLKPKTLLDAMLQLAQEGLSEMIGPQRSHAVLHVTGNGQRLEFSVDMRYYGQSHEINTPLLVIDHDTLDEKSDIPTWLATLDIPILLEATRQRFHQLHEQYSSHAMPDRAVEAVALRLKVVYRQPHSQTLIQSFSRSVVQGEKSNAGTHYMVEAVLASETAQVQPTTCYQRAALQPGDTLIGPAIVTQFDATTVIPPGWQAIVDDHSNLLLSV